MCGCLFVVFGRLVVARGCMLVAFGCFYFCFVVACGYRVCFVCVWLPVVVFVCACVARGYISVALARVWLYLLVVACIGFQLVVYVLHRGRMFGCACLSLVVACCVLVIRLLHVVVCMVVFCMYLVMFCCSVVSCGCSLAAFGQLACSARSL